MKKNIFVIIFLIAFISTLYLAFDDYSYCLNEPIDVEKSIKTDFVSPAQNKYRDDQDSYIFTLRIHNTVINSILNSIFRTDSVQFLNYDNNYIIQANNKTNIVEKKLYWDEKKYGSIQNVEENSNGDIFVLSYLQSNDMSHILQENIVKYSNNKLKGKEIYSIKHDNFVNEVNKSIYEIDILADKLVWAEHNNDILSIKKFDDTGITTINQSKVDNTKSSMINNIVMMEDFCYLTSSNNTLYKLTYNNNQLEQIANFNKAQKAVYKIYKYNENQLMLRLHKSFGEELQIYDEDKFEVVDTKKLPIDLFLSNNSINNLESYSFPIDYFKLLVYIVYLAILVLVIILLRYIYIHIFNRKIYITFKLVLCILPIMLIGNYCIAAFTAINNYEMVENELFLGKQQSFSDYYKAKNSQIAINYGAKTYLGDLLKTIKPYEDIDADTLEKLYTIMDYSFVDKAIDTEGWYWSIDIVNNDCMYKIIDSELNDTVFFSRYASGENEVADRIIDGFVFSTVDYNDKYIFCLYPVFDSQNNVTGMVQVGTYYYGYKNELFNKFFSNSSKKISVMTNILLVVLVLLTFVSLYPLLRLAKKIEGINTDTIEEIKEIKSNDEIQILTHAFNSMAKNINENMNKMVELNNSYYRFVPLELIKLLGKDDIKDVNLGDNVDKNITIVCVGINKFYDVMGKSCASKIFDTMANIYEYIGPIIRNNGGVIDRFIDKGLIAMFPKSATSAVNASIEIVKAISKQNLEDNKFDGINLSCAINVGEVTFGIIGEERRLQNSAISYTTNLATVMQENSSRLSSNIIISKTAYDKLDKEAKIACRYLGNIRFSIIGQNMQLYDIYEADSESVRKLKNINEYDFENAIKSFEDGDYNNARQSLVKVLDRNIEEEIARNYFYEADKRINLKEHNHDIGPLEI